MDLKPFKKWQLAAIAYLLLCLLSSIAVAEYATILFKTIIIWQSILAAPLLLVVKLIFIYIGGFWTALFGAALILSTIVIAPSVQFLKVAKPG